jgi:hypothetical protein
MMTPKPVGADHSAVAPTNIGWQALGPSLAFTVLSFLVVGIRWYTRAVLIRSVGKEDLLITLSMVQ